VDLERVRDGEDPLVVLDDQAPQHRIAQLSVLAGKTFERGTLAAIGAADMQDDLAFTACAQRFKQAVGC
jgi:hypothetical protein